MRSRRAQTHPHDGHEAVRDVCQADTTSDGKSVLLDHVCGDGSAMTPQAITGWAITVDGRVYQRQTHALELKYIIYPTKREADSDRRTRFGRGAHVVRVTITIEEDG